MAIARKCDRCGNFFMPDISNSGHRHTFVKLNTYYTTGINKGTDIHNMDLCNECNQSLEEWIAQEHKNNDVLLKQTQEINSLNAEVDRIRWIPVEERLPEEEGVYVVSTNHYGGSTVVAAFYTYGSLYWDEYVTAWMPKPEPYKEQTNGEEDGN